MEAIKTTTNLNDFDGLSLVLHQTGHVQNCLFLDTTEDTDDGTWETVEDWIKFCDELDNQGTDRLLEFYFGNNDKPCNWDNFTIHKFEDSIDSEYYQVKVIFNEPTDFCFGIIGDKENHTLVNHKITEFVADFHYETYWRKSGRQKNYCNGIEIYLSNIKFLK